MENGSFEMVIQQKQCIMRLNDSRTRYVNYYNVEINKDSKPKFDAIMKAPISSIWNLCIHFERKEERLNNKIKCTLKTEMKRRGRILYV